MRTLSYNNLVIDGNPELIDNGGAKGLADHHCVGSFINHSETNSNAKYNVLDLQSPYLTYRREMHVPMFCIIIMTRRKILKHEQILINYQTSHFNTGKREIPFT